MIALRTTLAASLALAATLAHADDRYASPPCLRAGMRRLPHTLPAGAAAGRILAARHGRPRQTLRHRCPRWTPRHRSPSPTGYWPAPAAASARALRRRTTASRAASGSSASTARCRRRPTRLAIKSASNCGACHPARPRATTTKTACASRADRTRARHEHRNDIPLRPRWWTCPCACFTGCWSPACRRPAHLRQRALATRARVVRLAWPARSACAPRLGAGARSTRASPASARAARRPRLPALAARPTAAALPRPQPGRRAGHRRPVRIDRAHLRRAAMRRTTSSAATGWRNCTSSRPMPW